ncbi:glycogen debranching N-terminal domain-containing protein [Plantibacter sp. Mn2098]|uniref:glycogen debranching N-terminal domain-containing protein n=1 Tax=Plantibacter sp. Mn2098 TaxID=3395266 RepID=UPI003BE78611
MTDNTTAVRTRPVAGGVPLQPLLQDSVVALRAPSQAWSAPNGEMGGAAIDGFAHSETRVLRSLRLRIDGELPEHIATAAVGASEIRFVSLVRNVDDRSADPRVRLDRHRTVGVGELRERLVLSSTLHGDVPVVVELSVGPEFGEMQHVKAGLPQRSAELRWEVGRSAASIAYQSGSVSGTLDAPGAEIAVDADGDATVRWAVVVPGKGSVSIGWSLAVVDETAAVAGVATPWNVAAPET